MKDKSAERRGDSGGDSVGTGPHPELNYRSLFVHSDKGPETSSEAECRNDGHFFLFFFFVEEKKIKLE